MDKERKILRVRTFTLHAKKACTVPPMMPWRKLSTRKCDCSCAVVDVRLMLGLKERRIRECSDMRQESCTDLLRRSNLLSEDIPHFLYAIHLSSCGHHYSFRERHSPKFLIKESYM
jgi:hypothetical protein